MFGLGVKLTALCVCLLSALPTIHGLEQGAVIVEEGRDVILPCSLVGTNIEAKLFDWRKFGETGELKKEVFMYDAGDHYNNGLYGQDPQFKGRVSHFQEELKHGNASIVLTETKVADSGNYTCDFPHLEPRQTFNIKLLVFSAALKPYITKLDQTKDWALLQCEVFGVSPKPEVQWQDSEGNIIPAKEPHVTERGGRYDVTVLTNVTKTDNYSCVASQEEIHHQTHAKTFVFIDGAALKPYITILDQTKDWALLQCDVKGVSPKPKLQWQDSEGNIIPAGEPQVTKRGGRYDVTVLTNVTKTDNYSCVATQEEIHHQTHAKTFVFIHVKVCEDPSSKVPEDPSNTDPSNTVHEDPSNTVHEDPSNTDPSNTVHEDPSNTDPSNTVQEDPSRREAIGWSVGFLLGALSLAAVQLVLVWTKRISINFNKGCSWWKSPDEGTPDEKGALSSSEQNGTKETALVV